MPKDDGVEQQTRHDAGKSRVEVTDEESADFEPPPKVFAADRRGNDEAAAAAALARGEEVPFGFGDLDGEWKKAGGGHGGAPALAAAGEEAGPAPGGLAAWGPPAPRVADALRVLADPAPWVRL